MEERISMLSNNNIDQLDKSSTEIHRNISRIESDTINLSSLGNLNVACNIAEAYEK